MVLIDELADTPGEAFTRALVPPHAAQEWVCGFCDRGQCGRCSATDCTCCNGNPEEQPWRP